MKDYWPRLADKQLEKRLQAKGAVLIQGPKWCGKTETAKQQAGSVLALDQPDQTTQYLHMAELSPTTLLKGETPRLIDEWQLAPQLWNAVRYEVDQRGINGQFILTGSALPADLDPTAHTGTGRISRLTMRPMSLFESRNSSGQVSLTQLFAGENLAVETPSSLEDICYLICRGGWPQAAKLEGEPALFQAQDYYEALVEADISRVDSVTRDREKAKRLLRSYARHVGNQASLETIRQDILASAEDSFDQKTLYSYLAALNKIFVIEDVPAWNPNLRSKTAIRTTDTRYFVDPSIAVAALGLGPQDLMHDLETLGLLFENLCIRDLRIYTEYLGGNIYHYRDKADRECDAVIHLRQGHYGLVEVKLGGDSLIEEGAENLKRLAADFDTSKMPAPSFLLILCAKAPYAYRRADGIYIVPITSLCP